MAEKKKQHYVPKGYFRIFSKDGKVDVIVKETNEIIHRVPIETQGFKKYFYSKDRAIEDFFAKIEGKCLPLLNRIVLSKSLKNFSKEEYTHLLRYISFQHSRTPKSKEDVENACHTITQKLVSDGLSINEDEYKSFISDIHLRSIKHSLDGAHNLRDLKFFVLFNCSETPFITSDHPVVFYNPALCHVDGSWEGIKSPGLCVFFSVVRRHYAYFL